MGTRVLQLVLIVLLIGCVAWASAIFFGPWALTKYLEGQVGDAVEVSGLRVTPKLAVTASRVQVSDARAVTASLRGIEVDWRLLTGGEPAVLISVASGGFVGSLTVEDLQVTLTQAEGIDPLKISGMAARAGDPNSVSAADVKFEAHTDYNFQLLRRLTATTGYLTAQHPLPVSSTMAKLDVDHIDLGADLLQQKLGGILALTNVVAAGPNLSIPEADLKFALANSLLTLSLSARNLLSETAGVIVRGLTTSMEYDAARARLSGPINVAVNDLAWKDIRLPAAEAKATPGEEQFKISVEGNSLGSEIHLGRRYIGRAPDASFAAKLDASSLGGSLQISGDARLAATQQLVELDLSFQGIVLGVSQPVVCIKVACEVSDVTYEYSLNVAGETLSGTSRCLEPACLSVARTHNLSTTDTNKFFANLQSINLISPLVLGGAYAQMLQGVAVGKGHKIDF